MWRHHLKLNAIVFIWSFTAILGQWITLERLELVFLRTFFAGLLLYGLWKWRHRGLQAPPRWPRHPRILLANGALVGFHWVLFFTSAKLNASICLAGYATTTLWTALLDPLVNRTPWRRLEIVLGVIIALALAYISRAESQHLPALLFGLASAVTAALFAVFNGRWARGEAPIGVTILEMAGAAGFCLAACLVKAAWKGTPPSLWPAPTDWLWLSVLIVFCTAYAYAAYIELLRHLSVFTISLAANFEPVYGMILAAWLLGESATLSVQFYLGSLIILLCVLVHTWAGARSSRRQAELGSA
jgi:drug/metabolite transporter (DMT)-like permease